MKFNRNNIAKIFFLKMLKVVLDYMKGTIADMMSIKKNICTELQ